MNTFLERLLRCVDPPDAERAEVLWAKYRADGKDTDAAFATLIAWYGKPLYRRIWGFVRSDAAEDVFQEILAKLHRERKNLATFEHALRWLRTVAVNQAVDARRRAARSSARHRRAARPEATTVPENDMQEALSAGLGQLPPDQQQAIALHYFEGMTKKDAAAVLGIDRDTFAARISKALERLKSLVPVPALLAGGTAALESRLSAHPPALPPAKLALFAARCGSPIRWMSSTKWKFVGAFVFVAAVAAATGYYLNRSPEMPAKSSAMSSPKAPRLGVEVLEDRTVPTVGFQSALSVGNDTGSTEAVSMATDAAGNSYLTGRFNETLDFDPTHTHPGDADILTARGSGDIFVAKYAVDNTLVWVRRMGGDAINTDAGTPDASMDTGKAIHVDGSGNVYVTGEFRETADFGTITLTSTGRADGFIAKLNAAGSVQWAKSWGSGADYDDDGKRIATDAAGNVYVLGGRTYRLNDQLLNISPNHGIDILKYTSTGTSVWTKSLNTQYWTSGHADMTLDTAGNVFVGGGFSGSVDFDPGPKSKNYSAGSGIAGYVLKLTAAGNYSWVSTFTTNASSDRAGVQRITLDGSGNVIVGGQYKGTADFKPGNGTTNLPVGGGAYIAKLNGTGGLVWVRAIESSSTMTVYGLDVDAAGNIYAVGTFYGTADFDPSASTHSRTSAGSSDAYVMKLTGAGTFAWAETFGDTGLDTAMGVDVSNDGTVSLVGRYRGTIDFDPGTDTHSLTAPGDKSSFYLLKLRQN